MKKVNTPIHKLYNELLNLRFEAHANGNEEYKNAINTVIRLIENKRIEEKKVIISAFNHGTEVKYDNKLNNGETYYDVTFNDYYLEHPYQMQSDGSPISKQI